MTGVAEVVGEVVAALVLLAFVAFAVATGSTVVIRCVTTTVVCTLPGRKLIAESTEVRVTVVLAGADWAAVPLELVDGAGVTLGRTLLAPEPDELWKECEGCSGAELGYRHTWPNTRRGKSRRVRRRVYMVEECKGDVC